MKKIIIIPVIILLTVFQSNAQSFSRAESASFSFSSGESSYTTYNEEYKPKKNLIKLNLTGLPLRNYSVQYERVLSKRLSVAFSYRNMPEGNLPMKDFIIDNIDSPDQEAIDIINNFTISNYAITPEIRLYLGRKGYGRGFYIAPFYRSASYSGGNMVFHYQDDNNVEQNVTLSGDIKSQTFGLMFGAQWSLSRFLVLDWWILGPHAGNGKGDLIGTSSQTMTADQQNELRQNLEDFEIPMVKKTVSVNANGATMSVDGVWAGIRAGISLGIKF